MTPFRKFQALYPVFLISITIALCITGLVTWLQTGTGGDFVQRWLKAAAMAVVVMLPLGSLVMVQVGRIVSRWWGHHSELRQRIVFALLMGLSMEALATGMATGANLGLSVEALAQWAHAYVRALPLGLCIGLFMAFVVRPWLQARMLRYGMGPKE